MLNKNKILIHILITNILCVSSLDVITKFFDYVVKLSNIFIVSFNNYQNCDETRESSCFSSAFITIIQSLSYTHKLILEKQK